LLIQIEVHIPSADDAQMPRSKIIDRSAVEILLGHA